MNNNINYKELNNENYNLNESNIIDNKNNFSILSNKSVLTKKQIKIKMKTLSNYNAFKRCNTISNYTINNKLKNRILKSSSTLFFIKDICNLTINMKFISYREIYNYFLSKYLENNIYKKYKEETKNINKFKSNWIKKIFSTNVIYELKSDLFSDYIFIIFLNDTKLNLEDEFHRKICISIIYKLTNYEKDLSELNKENQINEINCYFDNCYNKFKSKYLNDELQKNDINIFSLLQLLKILDFYFSFFNENIFNKNEDKNIWEIDSFFYYSIKISSIIYNYMIKGNFNGLFNINKNIFLVVDKLYYGFIQLSIELFNQNFSQLNNIFYYLKKEADDLPSSILWKFKIFSLKFNICDQEKKLELINNSSNYYIDNNSF